MCGIAGFIGESTNPKASFDLMTALFDNASSRGTDAAGFWGTQSGEDGKILYHKEGISSTQLIKKKVWKEVEGLNPNMMLCHARSSSIGVGTAYTNENNHPHVSEDRTLGLIHNGRVPDSEYDPLKEKYEVKTRCDSEIILRMIEAQKWGDEDVVYTQDDSEMQIDSEVYDRLAGCREVWRHICNGHMAVAFGEYLPETKRRIWFFRNKHRPIMFADMRKHLGQIFFFSTFDMWRWSIRETMNDHHVLREKVKITEMPTEEVWTMFIDKKKPVVDTKDIYKFEMQLEGLSSYQHKGEKIPVLSGIAPVDIYTDLNDKGEPNNKTYNSSKKYYQGTGCATGHGYTGCAKPTTTSSSKTKNDEEWVNLADFFSKEQKKTVTS